MMVPLPAQLRRAEIFARQGEREAADAEYEQARQRWARADAEIQAASLPTPSIR